MMQEQIEIGSLEKEGVLQVAKWQKWPLLIDEVEMGELFASLSSCHLVHISSPVFEGGEEISIPSFLAAYREYVSLLKEGQLPDMNRFRPFFSCALSVSLTSFYAALVQGGRRLIRPKIPVIQLQSHTVFYSSFDKQFHSMVQGKESILWGIQFSYPELFQDRQSKKILKVRENATCENTPLFNRLTRWVRNHTLPTPFVVEGVRTNCPIRIGKKALGWINHHPQLKEQSITVDSTFAKGGDR